SSLQSHPSTKAESREQYWPVWKFVRQVIQSGCNIVLFSAAIVVNALAQPGATEVESQHGISVRVKRLRDPKDNFVVKRTAEERMRVADQRDAIRILARD